MSTAMLMAAGAEQPSGHASSADLLSDQLESKGVSFAKSFRDRVQSTDVLEGKGISDSATTALPGLKNALPAARSDEAADSTGGGLKIEGIAVQKMFGQVEPKSRVAGRDKQQRQGGSVVGGNNEQQSREKTTTPGNFAAQNANAPTTAVTDAEDISRSPVSTAQVPMAAEDIVPAAKSADGDGLVVASRVDRAVQKDAEPMEKTKAACIDKNTVKTQEGSTASKAAGTSKGTGKIAETAAVAGTSESKVVAGNAPADAVALAPVAVVAQSESGNAAKGSGKEIARVTKTSGGASSAIADGSVRKAALPETKTDPTNAEASAVATDGEKTVTSAVSAAGDGENKTGGAAGSFAGAIVHATAAGLNGAAGLTPGVMATGDTSASTGAKGVVGEAAAHTTGLPNGLREQEGAAFGSSTDGAPQMLTASPTALEVGIQNGTHGWLKVRAEMTDGVVNASVSAASPAGQEMLHRELPSLTTYLQEEKVAVSTVVVHAPAAAGFDTRSFSGTDGAGGGASQGSNGGGEQQRYGGKAVPGGSQEMATYSGLRELNGDESVASATYAVGGGWLSVRA